MKKFLEYVAEDIINKYGTDLSRIAVVFPNKRASLFLNEILANKSKHAIWSPAYITISEFFRNHSDLVVDDSIKLICEIYKSFTSCTKIDEPLDHFFGWGQLLLADFDDIDKNMANAEQVFNNIKDLRELDDLSYLDDEQKEILRKFFSNFTDNKNSELKQRFLNLWCHLGDIYTDFRQNLRKQKIAYEGMLYRDVATDKSIQYNYEMYLFVGFNVVQKVEQKIFLNLQKEGKAHFYWDFDKYYLSNNISTASNEAGRYISQYLKIFPNELDFNNTEVYDNFKPDKKITLVRASTNNIQARYVSNWLKENNRYEGGRNTAIVLCDESLLPTVIHCIPEEVKKVNITTGFPLFQTQIATFVSQLFELRILGFSNKRNSFKSNYVMQIMSHPYAKYLTDESKFIIDNIKSEKIYNLTSDILSVDEGTSFLFKAEITNKSVIQWIIDLLKIIARNIKDSNKDPFASESIFRMYTLCNRINGLIKSGDLDVDIITLQRLITQLLNSTSIPFHGEPVSGIQVMGILETRNLDFEHVLILSCNEGNMPKGINDASFIPYSIRKANNLTTIDNKVAIYAYYFYNLIQRAKDVTITYNSSTENGSKGEMSRFMLQLMIESNMKIDRMSLQAGQQHIFTETEKVVKNSKILEALNSINKIAPTSINRYMRCPLQFYYNNVIQITEDEDDELEKMSNRIFGNIFHESSEVLYSRLRKDDGIVTQSNIKYALEHKEFVERIVDDVFSEIAFNAKNSGKHIDYNGLQLINREVIIKYLMRLLEIDSHLAPFKIKDIESSIYNEFTIKTSAGERKINIGGRIDRLDQIFDKETGSERIRVIDYKTGRYPSKKINSISEVFERPIVSERHADYYLQTMLYAMLIKQDKVYNPENLPVSPALLFIQHSSDDNYEPTIKIGKEKVLDIAKFDNEFSTRISDIVSEIFEPTIPFYPTDDKSVCEYCPYRKICGR